MLLAKSYNISMKNDSDEISELKDSLLKDIATIKNRLELFSPTLKIHSEVLQKVWKNSEKEFREFIDSFYDFLNRHKSIIGFFEHINIEKLKESQMKYFSQMMKGEVTDNFIKDRIQLGIVHQKIGIPTEVYIGAYSHFFDFVSELGVKKLKDNSSELIEFLKSVNALFLMDISIVIDAYASVDKKKIEKQKAKIEDLYNQKFKFTKIFIHDIRNPLNLVFNYSSMIQSSAKVSKFDKIETYAQKTGDSLKKSFKLIDQYILINNLEDLLNYGKTERVDVSEMLGEVVESQGPLAEARNIKLNFKKLDTPTEIEIIPSSIEFCINNIISNAINFSEDGTEVQITLFEDENNVTLKIKDQGMGIAPNDLKDLFDADRKKANKPVDGSYSTGGWGLHYSKKILDAHHGTIEVESEVGVGTKVILTFPK